jgi:RNA polymerase sigma factor (sigma-70 family)
MGESAVPDSSPSGTRLGPGAPVVPRKSEAVLATAPLVRREVDRFVRDPELAEELAQETLARLLAAGDRLDPSALGAYARVVAHNVVRTHQRDERNRRRKATRAAAVEWREAPAADEEADLDGVEAAAAQDTLRRLSTADRELLEGRGAGVGHGPSAGARRVRLLRARARARVRYLLALRGLTPATDRCLPILDALAAGDRSRQRTVGADTHLAHCPQCASLAEDVVRRHRPLAVLVLLGGSAALWRALRQHPAVSVGGASAAVAVGLAAASLTAGSSGSDPPHTSLAAPGAPSTAPAPAPPTSPAPGPLRLVADQQPLLPVPPDVAARAGAEVRGDGVVVRSVVGDEAFWVGSSEADQLLVVLTGSVESPQQIAPGQALDFTGRLVPNTPETAASAGVDASEHADLLARQGVHLEVAQEALTVR